MRSPECLTVRASSWVRLRRAAGVTALALIALAGCSGDDGTPGSAATTTTRAATPERPAAPAADLSEEITGANAPFIASSSPARAEDAGYVEHEYVASGTASSYAAAGGLTEDGRWSFEPADTAPYRTRILVRRPAAAADFSGTVVVEWLNVSAGLEADPEYANLEEEILRQGHAWVGVSAQLIGVEGGPVLVEVPGAEGIAGEGLKVIDPERYSSLEHPGDGYSYDIFTQVARALAAGGPAMGDLEARQVIAAGESQSALALVTYHNGVQPLTGAFDGFLIHSRFSGALPLVGPGEYADLTGSIGMPSVRFRTDLDTPVLDLQTEGDVTSVLGSAEARQPDTDRFRLWEVAGTAHADTNLVGSTGDAIQCGVPINDGPLHVVAKAALRQLDEWVRTDEPPPEAPRIELIEGGGLEIGRDADGIALGGLRTPPVDVPVDVLSGAPGPNPAIICLLLGSTTPLPDDRLAELYSSRADYEQRYEAAVDEAIAAGFVLADDREALLAYADPSRIPG